MGAAERLAPYRARPPAAVVRALEDLGRTRMFVVQRPGPTSFVVQEEEWEGGGGAEEGEARGAECPAGPGVPPEGGADSGCGECGGGRRVRRTFRVLIGSRVSCTCQRRMAEPELCSHTLFVLTRVLRVPASNPIVWQLSLIDRELEEVLKCSLAAGKGGGRGGRGAAATPAGGRGKGVVCEEPDSVRHKPEDDGPCPICYEDMAGELPQRLVFCAGCGHNVHGRCLHVWANHQASIGKELSCPLCRRDWEGFKWNPAFAADPRARVGRRAPVESSADAAARRENTHYGTSCGACRVSPLQGARYLCAICEHFDLCAACFEKGAHALHPFTVQQTPGGEEVPADRAPPPGAVEGTAGDETGGATAGKAEAALAASRRAARRVEEGRRKAGANGGSTASKPGGGDRWGGAAARAAKCRGAAPREVGGMENDLSLLLVGSSFGSSSQGGPDPLSPPSGKPAPRPARAGSARGRAAAAAARGRGARAPPPLRPALGPAQ